eukprot:15467040-Alexandrium_andersonii.AAC.1
MARVATGLSRANSQGLRGFADWWIADWSSLLCDLATSGFLGHPFRRRIRNERAQWRRTRPPGASGADFEAMLGLA